MIHEADDVVGKVWLSQAVARHGKMSTHCSATSFMRRESETEMTRADDDIQSFVTCVYQSLDVQNENMNVILLNFRQV